VETRHLNLPCSLLSPPFLSTFAHSVSPSLIVARSTPTKLCVHSSSRQQACQQTLTHSAAAFLLSPLPSPSPALDRLLALIELLFASCDSVLCSPWPFGCLAVRFPLSSPPGVTGLPTGSTPNQNKSEQDTLDKNTGNYQKKVTCRQLTRSELRIVVAFTLTRTYRA
jgi:hypothetical protein